MKWYVDVDGNAADEFLIKESIFYLVGIPIASSLTLLFILHWTVFTIHFNIVFLLLPFTLSLMRVFYTQSSIWWGVFQCVKITIVHWEWQSSLFSLSLFCRCGLIKIIFQVLFFLHFNKSEQNDKRLKEKEARETKEGKTNC